MTLATVLRRAADHVEKIATAGTAGPWLIEYDMTGVTPQALFVNVDDDDPDYYDDTRGIGGLEQSADNQWASTVSPHIAPLLAGWLRALADDVEWRHDHNANTRKRAEKTGDDGSTYIADPVGTAEALALARSLLGEVNE